MPSKHKGGNKNHRAAIRDEDREAGWSKSVWPEKSSAKLPISKCFTQEMQKGRGWRKKQEEARDWGRVAVVQAVFRGEPLLLCLDNANCRAVTWVGTEQGWGGGTQSKDRGSAGSVPFSISLPRGSLGPCQRSQMEGKEAMETDFWRLRFLINCSKLPD